MKKIAWILMLGMVLGASSVHAEEAGGTGSGSCVGGTEFIGANGHHYCQSNADISWYAAITWCQSQGRHLASAYEACNADPSKKVPSGCSNVFYDENKITTPIWTSSNKDAAKAYIVYTHNGSFLTKSRVATYRAFCW